MPAAAPFPKTPPAYAGRRHYSKMVDQRLLMYIVISMPKRMSIASGVSHFMMVS
jgi:hypothetical protein